VESGAWRALIQEKQTGHSGHSIPERLVPKEFKTMFTYEEIRSETVSILSGKGTLNWGPVTQWGGLTSQLAQRLFQKERERETLSYLTPRLSAEDAELAREVFWDLFRQGYVILGLNDANPGWPFFRLSRAGQAMLDGEQPFRFHSSGSYLSMIKHNVPSIDDLTSRYLIEAIDAFYAGCLLASNVMLGVAAENHFEVGVGSLAASPRYEVEFAAVEKQRGILCKIDEFRKRLRKFQDRLPSRVREDLDSYFNTIQAVIRVSRNDAGHPTGRETSRETTFVNLQLFAPFGKAMSEVVSCLLKETQ
jgi:hypothetical protein